MYRQILVPTDGSEGSKAAVEHAIDLATAYGAVLHTLYVIDTNVGAEAGMVGIFDTLEEAGENAIEDVLQQVEAADVETARGEVVQGTPHRAILEYTDEHDIDLVVMGTHGRTGIDRYLLGSVTEKVVRLSEVPVLTVGMPTESGDERS